jgi:hypothetical protein
MFPSSGNMLTMLLIQHASSMRLLIIRVSGSLSMLTMGREVHCFGQSQTVIRGRRGILVICQIFRTLMGEMLLGIRMILSRSLYPRAVQYRLVRILDTDNCTGGQRR